MAKVKKWIDLKKDDFAGIEKKDINLVFSIQSIHTIIISQKYCS